MWIQKFYGQQPSYSFHCSVYALFQLLQYRRHLLHVCLFCSVTGNVCTYMCFPDKEEPVSIFTSCIWMLHYWNIFLTVLQMHPVLLVIDSGTWQTLRKIDQLFAGKYRLVAPTGKANSWWTICQKTCRWQQTTLGLLIDGYFSLKKIPQGFPREQRVLSFQRIPTLLSCFCSKFPLYGSVF